MSEVVNLRSVRKARRRAVAADEAQARRVLFGRTRAEREASESERQRADRALDGALRVIDPKLPDAG